MAPSPTQLVGVKVLLFDVLGTTVDWRNTLTRTLTSAASAAAAANPALAPLAASADWPALVHAWHDAYTTFSSAVAAGTTPRIPIEQHFRTSLAEQLHAHGLAPLFAPAQLDALAQAWGALDGWRDAAAGLDALRALGLRVSTLSNGSRAQLQGMAQHAALRWSSIHSAEDFGSFKPDPRVYLGAAAAEGVAPEECAMVAAHLPDLEAAARVGLRAIYVERPEEEQAGAAEAKRIRAEVVDLWVGVEEDGFLSVAEGLKKLGVGQ
ncbi:hypothetical protein FH972_023241 [Carpinus fangiana]|uniref:Haloacid dehalogenase, type II n=1 Tax=Carpinus fangiana TaxID=176857 RepID=A0A5N6KUM3_9ROSI|nr:hypothetical protein FH972_023241 [Carpinus fangiana]